MQRGAVALMWILALGCEEAPAPVVHEPEPATGSEPESDLAQPPESAPGTGATPRPEVEAESAPDDTGAETEPSPIVDPEQTFVERNHVHELRMAGGVPHVFVEAHEGEDPARPRFISHEEVDRVWGAGRARSAADGRTIRVFARDGHSCDGQLGRARLLGVEDSEPEQAGLFVDRESSGEADFRPDAPYNDVRWSWYAPVVGCTGQRFLLGAVGLSADAPRVVPIAAAPEVQLAISMIEDRLRARREAGRLADRQPPPRVFREGDVTYVHVRRNLEGDPRHEDDYGEMVWIDVRFGVGDQPQCLRFRRCREEEIGADYSRLPACRHWGRCSPAPLTREGGDCPAAPDVGYADLDGDGTPEYVYDYWMGLCDTGALPVPGWLHERDRPALEMRWVGLP